MTESVDTLLERAWKARREGRRSDARSAVEHALTMAREASDRGAEVRALKKLGHLERDEGHHAEARARWEEAVTLAREAGDRAALAHTLRHLGDLHRVGGRGEQAMEACEEALAITRELEDVAPLELANTLRTLALVRESGGLPDEARPLWREARDLYESLGLERGVAEADGHLGR